MNRSTKYLMSGLASLAVVASWLAVRPATDHRTWGYRRAEVLAAAAQAAVLLAVGGYILVESIRRLITAPEVEADVMVLFGLIGLVGKGEPFAIGESAQPVTMPVSGRLYLGVNDDHVPDNSGNFVVRIWEP